ncbi:MAG: acyl-CoA synthetase [Microthrixaceae bacterium]|nr:acyl-CoA synthetase [Microthrixaceae bacterium]MCO5313269.1 acyl-CoA synthetase [Microthrixaceae bacterium]
MNDVPQHNLAAVAEAVAQRVPDRTAIVAKGHRFTYDELNRRTRQLAHVLHDHGLGARPGGREGLASHESHQDHLAIYAYNGNEYLEAMIGAFKARVAPVNVNYRYVAEELRYLLDNSKSKAIVYHSAFAPTLAEVRDDLPELTLLLQIADDSGNELLPGALWYEEALAAASDELPSWAGEWSPDDLYILYTGGTTGMPKGVLWRQADIFRSSMGGLNQATGEPWETLDEVAGAAEANSLVSMPAAPFMHGAGHWIAFLGLNTGSTIVVQNVVERLDPVDICECVEREGIQFLQIVGDAFGRPILEEIERGNHDVSSLFILLSGGAALTQPIKQRYFEVLPNLMIVDGLGSSEGGGQGTSMTTKDSSAEPATFAPVAGSMVVSADLTEVLEPGHEGIGWLAKRGSAPLGYFDDAEKTARTFPVIDGVRYSVPGDRARYLADGSFELLGRDSQTINSGGEKIFVEEVEAAIVAHPDVADAVVVGRPSQRWGSEVCAIVQMADGKTAEIADLKATAAEHIARYKLPRAWVFVDRVLRSPAGKADYRWAASTAAEAPEE